MNENRRPRSSYLYRRAAAGTLPQEATTSRTDLLSPTATGSLVHRCPRPRPSRTSVRRICSRHNGPVLAPGRTRAPLLGTNSAGTWSVSPWPSAYGLPLSLSLSFFLLSLPASLVCPPPPPLFPARPCLPSARACSVRRPRVAGCGRDPPDAGHGQLNIPKITPARTHAHHHHTAPSLHCPLAVPPSVAHRQQDRRPSPGQEGDLAAKAQHIAGRLRPGPVPPHNTPDPVQAPTARGQPETGLQP